MTISVIVACKDSFYIVTDTLMRDKKYNFYTLNNQKVFFSEKHKIGLCISGQAVLHDENKTKSDVLVSYVVREFFEKIEQEDTIELNKLGELLQNYTGQNYSGYHNYFKFKTLGQKHEDDISYFYGGFDKTQNNKVVIYSHYEGKETEACYDSEIPYFSNYPQLNAYIQKVLETAPETSTVEQNLIDLMDKHSSFLLKHYIPYTCVFVNSKCPCSIGNKLHYVRFQSNKEVIEHKYFEYIGSVEEDEVEAKTNETQQAIVYSKHETVREALKDTQYNFNHEVVSMYEINEDTKQCVGENTEN